MLLGRRGPRERLELLGLRVQSVLQDFLVHLGLRVPKDLREHLERLE